MIATLGVLVVAALACAAGHWVASQAAERVLAERRDRTIDLIASLSDRTARIVHLELTIDEIRAKQLDTSLPLGSDVKVATVELPKEVEAEIALIDDEAGRDEFREQALLIVEQFPELEPQAIIDRVFG